MQESKRRKDPYSVGLEVLLVQAQEVLAQSAQVSQARAAFHAVGVDLDTEELALSIASERCREALGRRDAAHVNAARASDAVNVCVEGAYVWARLQRASLAFLLTHSEARARSAIAEVRRALSSFHAPERSRAIRALSATSSVAEAVAEELRLPPRAPDPREAKRWRDDLARLLRDLEAAEQALRDASREAAQARPALVHAMRRIARGWKVARLHDPQVPRLRLSTLHAHARTRLRSTTAEDTQPSSAA